MKPKCLYHGSPKKIPTNTLSPHQSLGVGQHTERLTAVYATDRRDVAIVMGLISGTLSRMYLDRNSARGILYERWPRRRHLYLYTVVSRGFHRVDRWQWCAKDPVEVLKVETLRAKDYRGMLRRATEGGLKEFLAGRTRRARDLVCSGGQATPVRRLGSRRAGG
jgi:hypothetical protein